MCPSDEPAWAARSLADFSRRTNPSPSGEGCSAFCVLRCQRQRRKALTSMFHCGMAFHEVDQYIADTDRRPISTSFGSLPEPAYRPRVIRAWLSETGLFGIVHNRGSFIITGTIRRAFSCSACLASKVIDFVIPTYAHRWSCACRTAVKKLPLHLPEKARGGCCCVFVHRIHRARDVADHVRQPVLPSALNGSSARFDWLM